MYVFYGNHSLSSFLLPMFEAIKTNVIQTIKDFFIFFNK